VPVQDVRWVAGCCQSADTSTFFYGNGTGNFVHKEITLAVKWAEFISDMTSYVTLRGRWCDITILNVHAQTQDKSDDYEELERVLDQFLK
jgi:hypothetical protein